MSRSKIKNITLYDEDFDRIDEAKKEDYKFNFSEFVRFCLTDKNKIEEYMKTLKN